MIFLESNKYEMKEMINNWLSIKEDKSKRGILLEWVLRNTLNSGSLIFSFIIIREISNLLHIMKDYDTLLHIYETFIKKDYLNIRIPNETFVRDYIETISFYVIGFINRDRLDGET